VTSELFMRMAQCAAGVVQGLGGVAAQALRDAAGGEEEDGRWEDREQGAGRKGASRSPSPGKLAQRAAVLSRLQGRDTPVETGMRVRAVALGGRALFASPHGSVA